jgi:hypothetical protein
LNHTLLKEQTHLRLKGHKRNDGAGDELLGSLPDAALDGSQGRPSVLATGLMILDATAADRMVHIYSGDFYGF